MDMFFVVVITDMFKKTMHIILILPQKKERNKTWNKLFLYSRGIFLLLTFLCDGNGDIKNTAGITSGDNLNPLSYYSYWIVKQTPQTPCSDFHCSQWALCPTQRSWPPWSLGLMDKWQRQDFRERVEPLHHRHCPWLWCSEGALELLCLSIQIWNNSLPSFGSLLEKNFCQEGVGE